MKIQHTRGGKTVSQIKEICTQLELEKEVLVVGLNSPDLYLRMIEQQGVYAVAVKENNAFTFKLFSGENNK